MSTCLTILWCREQPALAGALCWTPRGREECLLGRGDDGEDRVAWVRARPGGDVSVAGPSSGRISREHIRLCRDGDGLLVEALGRRVVKVNTTPITRCRVAPGDLVEIDRELLLLCESRPARLPEHALHEFGLPDADGIVGETPQSWVLRRQVAFAAATGGHVLIWGHSGTGKELVAQALHRRGGARGALIARNAATLPEGIIDAELFGNARNYPNPGMPERAGAIGEASGGSLFLDEIGELSHTMQAHLLRVLDAGEYQRLGEARPRRADFRMLGATNRALDSLKHDFLARFIRRIRLPDLNERRADIPLLAGHLLAQAQRDNPALFPAGVPLLHPRLVQRLVLHRYTTHVRELRQILWAALEQWSLQGGGKYLDLKGGPEPAVAAPQEVKTDPSALTRDDILAAYRRFGGVQARVPAYLGLRDRFQLNRLEKKLGITAADKAAAQQ